MGERKRIIPDNHKIRILNRRGDGKNRQEKEGRLLEALVSKNFLQGLPQASVGGDGGLLAVLMKQTLFKQTPRRNLRVIRGGKK